MRHRTPRNAEAARIAAAVDSQSRPYTDPKATYPVARRHQAARGSN